MSVSIRRRTFNTSVGAGLLLAPFLAALSGKKALAAPAGKRAKRVLLFCSMGTNPALWAPTGSETSFTLKEMMKPLEPMLANIVLADGMESGNPGNNHGAPDALTGLGHGGQNLISLDQFLGDQLIAKGIRRPITTLLLGAETNARGGKNMFYRNNNLPTIGSPISAFNTVFGGAVGMPPGGVGDGASTGPSPEKLLRRKKSILDVIRGEMGSMRGLLGAEERPKLDAHLDSLRQVEMRLTNSMTTGTDPGPVACAKSPAPGADTANPLLDDIIHMDIIVNAFACDITRVAAIQFGSDQLVNVDLPALGIKGDQHGTFLHGGDFKSLIKLENWLAEQFVSVMNKLKAIPEADGSGTLLDNTLLFWARDMGDSLRHNQLDMRFVFAGGAGGYLKTAPNGRYLHFNGGQRHEGALLSVLDAMGVTDFTGFGDPRLAAKQPLPGVSI